ncbi:helix-turn-helix domain-containing protein [Actinocatenispora rupis]|uniref:Transcriptional regulator n=1 Tax=Actinocatenispora rupis TaxID=519421 RepID=A0A8J3J494_9ACTN|nr:helix-turn-helix transcriptional regulator [Actinocatenispora rupis]GID13913.1 transcriptional regulator [Actinocatenispora rupis]
MSGNHRELGDLLRSRRERLTPADVGLPPGIRRRTRGLRREEVAALAAISPTYYAFLEQGRDLNPSRQVLDALATALRLSAAERGHLHELAYGAPPAEPAEEVLVPGVAELVDRLDPAPAYVTGRRWDVLAANRAACLLWTDWWALPPADRNMVWWMLTAPAARDVFVEWEREASAQLARFRAAAARHRDDPSFAELVDRLRAASPEMREWWPRHDVAPLSSGSKLLHHPVLGELRLRHVVLTVADAPEQKLVTFHPESVDLPRIAALVDR